MFTMITMSLPDKRDRIHHRAPRLLWQQVADDLRAEMDSGALVVDARLPGELELAEQYGVSRDTIRRAIQELVSEDSGSRRWCARWSCSLGHAAAQATGRLRLPATRHL